MTGVDGTNVALELEDGLSTWRVKHCLQAKLGIRTSEMQLLAGPRLLANSELLPLGDATEQPLQLTFVRTRPRRLPEFLQRKALASINAMTADGSTALQLAAHSGDAGLCQEILDDAELQVVSVQDFLGNSALHYAAQRDLTEVCLRLLARPDFAGVGAANNNGRTPLHVAASRGDATTCAAILAHRLIEASAAAAAVDALGSTAADLAASKGHDELAQDLRGLLRS